jgi:hypothetical protein
LFRYIPDDGKLFGSEDVAVADEARDAELEADEVEGKFTVATVVDGVMGVAETLGETRGFGPA